MPKKIQEEKLDARSWLETGGGGFDGGKDDLRAATFTCEGLIDMLNAYREYFSEKVATLQEQLRKEQEIEESQNSSCSKKFKKKNL